MYRCGRDNQNADALSRNPQGTAPREPQVDEVQVATINTGEEKVCQSLNKDVQQCSTQKDDFGVEQRKDKELKDMIQFLEGGSLPENREAAKKIAVQALSFTIIDGILYFVDSKHNHRKRCVMPHPLRSQIMEENHSSPMAGHFSGKKLYKSLVIHWWWQGMYSDVITHCMSCPQCAIVNAAGRVNKPPLHPIPVSRPFEIVGVDIMDLPPTKSGNRHVAVFQDFLTKFPLVYPVPDQKASRLARLLAEEVVPLFGVPEHLLSDRGTNLLSHLMTDLCKMLGIKKLNTTAYHPECDGIVERFNLTLKTSLRKHAATYGNQWDKYLYGVLYAYRNIPHESTGEKPSYLLYGMDLRTPSEAAILPPSPTGWVDTDDYREQVSVAKDNAVKSIRKAQQRYKRQYDRNTKAATFAVGQWVLVRFPADESGKNRKLSRPWHGPYRVTSVKNPDVSVVKVYFPQEKQIMIHQSRVKQCPVNFPAGFYWYGGKQKAQDRTPTWVQNLLAGSEPHQADSGDTCEEEVSDEDTLGEDEADTQPEESPREESVSPVEPESSRSPNTGYSLRNNPRPSKKMIDIRS